MIEFQFYPAKVNVPEPLGTVTLFEFLKANQNPSEQIKDIFRRIAEAEASGNLKEKAALKQENLYYFTPCVVSNGKGRKYTDIVKFTGLLVLDFDHIEHAEAFKYYLFEQYTCIIAGWVSPSKKGVKFLVQIPEVKTTDEFKAYFYGIGIELQHFKGFDGSGQNCILPLFLSYDKDLIYRENATTWTKKGKKVNEFKASEVEAVKIEAGDGDKEQVQRIILSLVEKIIDNGHPQIRAAAVTLGGYIATGYIDQIEGELFINSLIQNNSYLRKGVQGYCKTAKTAIQQGMLSQLKLKKHQ
ncbi:N-domain protein [Flavobacterium phage vB_FspM_lotta8-1]|uniref:N-domain protein n=3 Tax=Pippivirus TaxID=2843435 RepID=A0A6B9LF50_9CAUD|nr:N-domain protein [Flavobacterium phage vB_FspM_lotta8-1]YP_009854550.1 N-domain protein [Flavobacterium phage vB_FspM_pippi8-1]QHB38478.1 N-domain protein [Flavobacterium phage vB_FspM_lotta8-1]QHB38530.1 N-domain protein [Flavobacterium phage vB_FspM_lotta8-2]QHB38583.1 N-domain protein [Flavobacterium phage vB_FspM_pippi8-1]